MFVSSVRDSELPRITLSKELVFFYMCWSVFSTSAGNNFLRLMYIYIFLLSI